MSKNDEPLISVIVPVFNVASYLEACILSIIKQNVNNLQIILIDDGSTDGSGEICDRFSEYDTRITVIHQTNAGVSAARNAGLKIATGKYVSFVDADDILARNTYQVFLNSDISENSLVIGRIQKLSQDGNLLDESMMLPPKIKKDEFLKDLFVENKFSYLGFLWDKLFLRKIIKDNNLFFANDIKLNEDRLFILQYMFFIEKVHTVNEIIYFYRQRSNGVIVETRRNATVTDSEMTVLDSFREMQKICKTYSEELYYICSRKAFESALDLLNRVSKKDGNKRKILKHFLLSNSRICLSDPSYTAFEKLKIIGHAILGK